MFEGFGFLKNSVREHMLGVLVSNATVKSEPPRDTTKPFRHVKNYPTLVEILRRANTEGIGMIHFETAKEWGNGRETERDIISLLKELQGENLSPAVQVNGTVTSDGINSIHHQTGAGIVLQLRKEIMAQGIDNVLRYIDEARGGIAKVLIDASAGTGELMSEDALQIWYPALRAEFGDSFGYGFAGGLTGENTTQMIRKIRGVLGHSDFSIDIETGARTANGNGTDALDLNKVWQYAAASKEGFSEEAAQ
jgi:phosphoribosylanthranilate isomerase